MSALPAGRYFALSTEQIAPGERRAFWGDVALNRSAPDFPDPQRATGFFGSVLGYAGTGASIRDGRTDAVILRRSAKRCRADGGDEIQLSAVAHTDGSGVYRVKDGELRYQRGDVVVTDMAVASDTRLGPGRDSILRLPRAAVAGVVGRDPSLLAGRLLPATPLVSLLVAQLHALADALPALDDAGREAGLRSVADLALASLRIECGPELRPLDGVHWDGMWSAANRFIEQNLGDHELDSAKIAHALRCSRSYLYRLFARHDAVVMGYIQDARLRRSHQLLSDPACTLPIAELAFLCGFADPSGFTRSFRQRFGYTPRELRNGRTREAADIADGGATGH